MRASPLGLDRVIRKPELLEILGVSSASLHRWIADGRFPRAIKLGPNSVGWRVSEVQDWLATREPAGPEVSADASMSEEARSLSGSSLGGADQ